MQLYVKHVENLRNPKAYGRKPNLKFDRGLGEVSSLFHDYGELSPGFEQML